MPILARVSELQALEQANCKVVGARRVKLRFGAAVLRNAPICHDEAIFHSEAIGRDEVNTRHTVL